MTAPISALAVAGHSPVSHGIPKTICNLLPAVHSVASDVLLQASSSGAVDKELVLALKRRKMYARKGGRKGEGARAVTVFAADK